MTEHRSSGLMPMLSVKKMLSRGILVFQNGPEAGSDNHVGITAVNRRGRLDCCTLFFQQKRRYSWGGLWCKLPLYPPAGFLSYGGRTDSDAQRWSFHSKCFGSGKIGTEWNSRRFRFRQRFRFCAAGRKQR